MRDGGAQTGCDTLGPNVPAELLVWLSPAFPIGSFAYSQGLERAADTRAVSDRASLGDWLDAVTAHGALRADLILLAEAWHASLAADLTRLSDANDLALALQPSAERHLETTQQGNAFLATITAAWWPDAGQGPGDSAVRAALKPACAYPIAVGSVTAARGIALDSALMAYAVAAITNAASAAIRLSVIGQTDGQRIVADLMPMLRSAVHAAMTSTPDDLGSATFAADIASLAHETQYTRLFRS